MYRKQYCSCSSYVNTLDQLQEMKKVVTGFKKLFFRNNHGSETLPQEQEYEVIQYEQPYHHYASLNRLDLLQGCDMRDRDRSTRDTSKMGLKYSSPLSKRNKSKVSLTWILHDQTGLKNTNPRERRVLYEDYGGTNDLKIEQQWYDGYGNNLNFENGVRVAGRNDFYNNNFVPIRDDNTSESDRCRRRHRHRKRRETRKERREDFGYDIEDIDFFLTKSSLDNPGNIPVVVTCPSVLYKTRTGSQEEELLPLGTVVNAVFKKEQWLYAQTPHGEEGYLLYAACVPLGILPESKRLDNDSCQRVPCWESCHDIYPPPCGNLTDTDKTKFNRKARSECGYVSKNDWRNDFKQTKSLCGEETFDNLYMTVTSTGKLRRKVMRNIIEDDNVSTRTVTERHVLLVVNEDFTSYDCNMLSVCMGDVVLLIQGQGNEADVDSEWFYVRRQDGREGFIPSQIARHGYI